LRCTRRAEDAELHRAVRQVADDQPVDVQLDGHLGKNVMPEREIAPNFAAYDCITTDGRAIIGIMTADTPASVTLRQALGIEETVPREKIKRLTASTFSLMPPGLEQAMTRQELADLLAYLRGEK